MDRVRPLKFESSEQGGTQLDEFPTSLDPHEDFIDCRGVCIQNNSSNDANVTISRDADGNLTFKDVFNAEKKLTELVAGTGGLTEESHRLLDQLVHELAEDFYEEYVYSGNQLVAVVTWKNSNKLLKVREEQYTYSSGKIQQAVRIQYDNSGNEVERITETYTYSGSRIVSISAVRSTP